MHPARAIRLYEYTSSCKRTNEPTPTPSPSPGLVTPFSGQDVIARSVRKMKTATKTRVSLRDIQCPGVHSIIPIHARLRAMVNEPFCANHSVKYRRAPRRILGAELSLKCSRTFLVFPSSRGTARLLVHVHSEFFVELRAPLM